MVALRHSERIASTNDYYRQQAWNNSHPEPRGFIDNWQDRQREKLIEAESKIQWSELQDASRDYKIDVARAYVDPDVLAMGELLESDQAGNYRALSEPVSTLQENLYRAAKLARRFTIVGKHMQPVLANVRITSGNSCFTLTATNLESAIMVKIGAKQLYGYGAIVDTTIPAKLFADLLEQLPPERIDIHQTRGMFTMKCSSGLANIKTTSAAHFPKLATNQPGVKLGTVDETAKFKRALIAAADGASKELTRPALCYVKASFVGTVYHGAGYQLDSTDGYKLTTRQGDMSGNRDYATFTTRLPATAVKLVAQSLDDSEPTEIYDTESSVWFCQNSVDILVMKADVSFPDTSKIAAKAYDDSATVKYGEFLRAIKATPKEPSIVTLTGKGSGSLTVTGESVEHGDSRSVLAGSIKRDFGVLVKRDSLIKTLSALGGSSAKPKKNKKTGMHIPGDSRDLTIEYSWKTRQLRLTIDGKSTILMAATAYHNNESRDNDYWMFCDDNIYNAE